MVLYNLIRINTTLGFILLSHILPKHIDKATINKY